MEENARQEIVAPARSRGRDAAVRAAGFIGADELAAVWAQQGRSGMKCHKQSFNGFVKSPYSALCGIIRDCDGL